MLRSHMLSMAACSLLFACSMGAMTDEQIAHTEANCENVGKQIGMLQKEREDHNQRMRAGIASVLPVAAIAHLVEGDYRQNVEIASGTWAEKIDAKIVELTTLQASCVAQGWSYRN